MNTKNIDTLSYNFFIPESLKTDIFEISVFLNLKESSSNKNEKNLIIEDFYKQASCVFKIKLNDEKDLSKCIIFFKSLAKRTFNLIRFKNWDDEKEFDFTTNYNTNFYFSIPNIYRLYNEFHINCNPLHLEKPLKELFINNFLNI